MPRLAQLTDKDWDTLLIHIQNKQVMPVVGPELVSVGDNGQQLALIRGCAEYDFPAPTDWKHYDARCLIL